MLSLKQNRIVSAVRLFRDYGGATKSEALQIMIWSVLAALTEAISIAMLIPLFTYIEEDGDLSGLAEGSDLWTFFFDAFDFVGIPVELMTLSGMALTFIILRQFAYYSASVVTASAVTNTEMRLRNKLFQTAAYASIGHLDRFGSGAFVEVTLAQCKQAVNLLQQFATLWSLGLVIIAYLAIFLSTAFTITLLAIGVCGLGSFVVRWFSKKTRHYSKIDVVEQRKYLARITERFRARMLVKMANAESRECALSAEHTQRLASVNITIAKLAAKMQLVLVPTSIGIALITLNIAVGFYDVPLAVITLFVLAALRLLTVFFNLARVYNRIANRMPNLERVVSVIDGFMAEREKDSGTEEFRELRRSIRFKNITFQYDGESETRQAALSNVDLEIPAGKITAVIGPSGAGKTTLVNLLPRLVDASEGQVLLDDQPIDSFSLKSLRQGISVISQTPILFEGTIRENISYVLPAASDEQIIEACEAAYINDFIMGLPDGYESAVGEAGVTLSGGQRQRMALARAFLAKSSILILDEPTSALDHQSEAYINKAVENLARENGATIIIVAHRASTVQSAGFIISMREGSVSAAGLASELQRDEEWYSQMLASQDLSTGAGPGRS